MAGIRGWLLVICSIVACVLLSVCVLPQPAEAQILLNHIRAVKAGQDPASVPHGHAHDHAHAHAHAHGGHDHYHGGHDHGHAHAHGGHDHSHGGHDHGHVHSHGGHDHSHGGHDHGHVHSYGGSADEHDHSHSHGGHDHSHSQTEAASTDAARSKWDIWTNALIATAIVCAAPVFILPFIPIGAEPHQNEKLLNVLLAFAAGGLLGDVFLHLLPHAMHPHSHGDGDHGHSHSHDHDEHDHTEAMVLGLWVIAGIMGFFLLEKAMRNYSGEAHGHSHAKAPAKPAIRVEDTKAVASPRASRRKEAEKSAEATATKAATKAVKTPSTPAAAEGEGIKVAGYLNLIADFSHNFTDGLAIGASYLVSDKVGFSTTVAILLHEVPHEIGDFAILVQSGFTKNKAMLAQFSTAIGAIVGTVIGLLAKDVADSTAWVLPLTAGGFIYIATTTVFPALLEEPGFWQTVMETIAICIGVALMVLIAYFE